MTGETELLAVTADAGDYDRALRELRMIGKVTMTLPPRLAVVVMPGPPEAAPPESGGPAPRPELPEDVSLYESAVPVEVVAALNPPERMFVEAWLARKASAPGENLSGAEARSAESRRAESRSAESRSARFRTER